MAITKLTSPVTQNDAIRKINEIIDDIPASGDVLQKEVGVSNGSLVFSDQPTIAVTWTTPTVYSNRCTISSGGYYKDGQRVYVEMRLTNAYARTSTSRTYTQYLTGFPAPLVGAIALVGLRSTSSTVTEGIIGYINSAGNFFILNGYNMALTSGDIYTITGSYFTTA